MMTKYAEQKFVLALLVGLSACSEPSVSITVELASGTDAVLDPFVDLAKLRVSIDGPERFDDATIDLSVDGRKAVFSNYPTDRNVQLEVKGFDAEGTLRAYGRKTDVAIGSDDLTLSVPFRKLLAYVIHSSICDRSCPEMEACVDAGSGFSCVAESDQCADCGDGNACVLVQRTPRCLATYQGTNLGPGQIYVLDVNTRKLVKKIDLPMPGAVARSIRAYQGNSMVVTFEAGAKAYVGILSQEDHTWRTIEFTRTMEIAFLSSEGLGIAAGSGSIVFFEADTGTVLEETKQAVVGSIVDGTVGEGGTKAVIVMSKSPGILLVDFRRRTITPPGEVEGASGVGLSEDGRIAYITSATTRTVRALDFRTNGLTSLRGEYSGRPGISVYSEAVSGLLSIYSDVEENISRLIGYSVSGRRAFEANSDVQLLPLPRGIAAIPGGGRVVVVSAGTSTQSAGLTLVDPDLERGLDASTTSYPRDPDDSYLNALGEDEYQRYRPLGVAVVYGR